MGKIKWLPIEPLTQTLKAKGYLDPNHSDSNDQTLTLVSLLSDGLRGAYYKATKRGYISDYHADNIAIVLKLHPSEIWSDWPERIGGQSD